MSIIISLTACSFCGVFVSEGGRYALNNQTQNEYLRIHIRADSNQNADQGVKYLVRDEVVAFLTPLVADYPTKAQAIQGIRENLNCIEGVAKSVLVREGFAYGASAELKTEYFPTRVYGEYTLPAGEYTALILRLGRGEGDNWWCVVYPPLCFANTDADIVYKSKILEIIRRFKAT
ncbi:MAG: stage II sporulation protein R [Clostridia bacterium]|nr:stage II sporulation protein R [Clostridia bacterium]